MVYAPEGSKGIGATGMYSDWASDQLLADQFAKLLPPSKTGASGDKYAFQDTQTNTKVDVPAWQRQKPNVPNWKAEPLKDMTAGRGLMKGRGGAGVAVFTA